MTALYIGLCLFSVIFAAANLIAKKDCVFFLIRVDKSHTDMAEKAVSQYRTKTLTLGIILFTAGITAENAFKINIPYFYLSLCLTSYVFVIFVLFIKYSKAVFKIISDKPADGSVREKSRTICAFHFILHLIIFAQTVVYTISKQYDYLSFQLFVYPLCQLITAALGFSAFGKYKNLKTPVFTTSLLLTIFFAVIQNIILY